jgi:hypothetical protein
LLHDISDEAIDFVLSFNRFGRQIVAVLSGALATKLYGDPDTDYAFEWTEGEEIDAEIVPACALRLEQLRRAGAVEVTNVPVNPWAPGAVFEFRTRRSRVHCLDARGMTERLLHAAWECPADFVGPDVAAPSYERRMSRRRPTAWSFGSVFRSSPATKHVC